MAVTLNQLSSFLAVAREGSVSAAAEKLYVTQPSISAAVSSLSKELGVDLTERVGRGIGLTAAGEAFLPVDHGHSQRLIAGRHLHHAVLRDTGHSRMERGRLARDAAGDVRGQFLF